MSAQGPRQSFSGDGEREKRSQALIKQRSDGKPERSTAKKFKTTMQIHGDLLSTLFQHPLCCALCAFPDDWHWASAQTLIIGFGCNGQPQNKSTHSNQESYAHSKIATAHRGLALHRPLGFLTKVGNPAGESDSEEQAISSDSKEQKKWRPQVSIRQRQQNGA